MKTLSISFALLFMLALIPSLSQACSCAPGSLPIDPTEAIVNATRAAIESGRGDKIDPDTDVSVVRTFPTLGERLNLIGYKGTSCEVRGPNNESHFLCAGKNKADFKVVVHRAQGGNCEVVVRALSTTRSVRAHVIENTCTGDKN